MSDLFLFSFIPEDEKKSVFHGKDCKHYSTSKTGIFNALANCIRGTGSTKP